MKFSSSASAPVFAGLGCLRRRVVARWPRGWSRATASGTIALCGLCAFVCMLIASPPPALATTVAFSEPGEHMFSVPAGVSSVEVSAAGADGNPQPPPKITERGGKGALVSGELSVMPGETLYVEVGAAESGQASDVRTSPRSFGLIPDDRLIVAGAGGEEGGSARIGQEAQAESGSNAGEGGGGLFQGQAGTQTHGGAGGPGQKFITPREERQVTCEAGHNGELGIGGSGGFRECEGSGGNGGDGYYGGGGGGATGGEQSATAPGGGGGGSSLLPPGGREEGLAPFSNEPKVEITYGGPAVITDAASEVKRNIATLSGSVNPEGETVSDCHFEYGPTEAYGTIVPCPTSPGSGTTPVPESLEVRGLKADTTYYYRLVATNPTATRHGHNVSFTTSNPPTVETLPATGVEQTVATLNATVNPEGTTLSDCHFEYGPSTEYGTHVPCSPEPGVEKEPVPVSASLTGLNLATTYHFRIVATNQSGTTKGNDVAFQTLGSKPVVTKLSPISGPAGGGTTITITGKNLTGATAVQFGSLNAASFLVKSATAIVAESPGEGARAVDVRVTTPNGTSFLSSADHFRFGPPTVTSVSPNTGGIEGNNSVTITGTGFGLGSEATLFKFGSTEATTVNCTSSTSCTVAVPSHVARTVDVKATVSGGSSPKAVPADQYLYG